MLRYNCEENDNHIKFFKEDGDEGEFLFGDIIEDSWLVIGVADMIKAFEMAGYDCYLKRDIPDMTA